MINRVLQLNISQLESSFNSLLEKHRVLNSPNQPNPNPIQSVIDRGNLRTQKTRHVHKRIIGKCLQEELGSSDRTGKLVKCEDNRVIQVHDRTGETCGIELTRTQFKNLFPPNIVILHLRTRTTSSIFQPTRRTWTSTFPGEPNAMVKRSHGINVHNLIQQVKNHPQRKALQSYLQQQAFNPFS